MNAFEPNKSENQNDKDKPAKKTGEKVLIGLSGSAHSCVAAGLLKTQGYDVSGAYLHMADKPKAGTLGFESRCSSRFELEAVKAFCQKIEIPLVEIDARGAFSERIVDYCVHELLQQRRPSPCIRCNSDIKFEFLIKKADELKIEKIATGHFAQVILDMSTGMARLQKALSPERDQSFTLFNIKPAILKRTLMPLGGIPGRMVDRLLIEYGFKPLKQFHSSKGYCFTDNKTYPKYVDERVAMQLRPKGIIVTTDNQIVGSHDGFHYYYLGQKDNLVLTMKEKKELYVIQFNHQKISVVVGAKEYLYKKYLFATETNWVRKVNALQSFRCAGRITPNGKEASCRVIQFENQSILVEFDQPQWAPNPGQAIVFYEADEVLGGGFIETVYEKDPTTVLTAKIGPSAALAGKKPGSAAQGDQKGQKPTK